MATTYQPVGVCIYCGAKRYALDTPRKLGLEHIIPEGLGGELLLPEASCRKCERLINKAETHVMRESLLGCRTFLGLTSNPASDRELPLYADTETETRKRMHVAAEDYPVWLLLPSIGVPGALTEGKYNPNHVRHWARQFRDTYQTLLDKYGIRAYSPPAVNAINFGRMLAKIGHAFAVAEFGVDGIEAVLPNVALGRAGDAGVWWFVGGQHEIEPPGKERHEINIVPRPITEGGWLIQVRIRLFANLGAPTYYVMAGRLGPRWEPVMFHR